MMKFIFIASALIILSFNLAQAANNHSFIFQANGKSQIEISAEKNGEKITLQMISDGTSVSISEPTNAKPPKNGEYIASINYGTVPLKDLGRLVRLANFQDNDQRNLVEEILTSLKLNKETAALDAAAEATTYDALSTIIEKLESGLTAMEITDAQKELEK